jgi:acetoin utilization deacetylase AcuC-like enzyme
VDVDVDVDTLGEVKDSQEDDAYLEKNINNLKEQHEKELLSMKEGGGNCAQEEIVKELKAEIERLTNELKLKQQQQQAL